MTGQENERLAKVETLVGVIGSDVSEVKTDVKELKSEIAVLRSMADRRSGVGDFVRGSIPWLALLVSTLSAAVLVWTSVAG